MREEKIEVDSYIGATLEFDYLIHDSKTLVVILPGSGYGLFGPSLYYSFNLTIELGFDALGIEYGFQINNKPFNRESMPTIISECKEAIDKAICKGNYENIVFIGKSLGTQIIAEIIDSYSQRLKVIPIYITPLYSMKETIVRYESLVVVGTKDKAFSLEHINDIKNLDTIELYMVPGAGHDLDVASVEDSIEFMKGIISTIKFYILRCCY